MHSNSKFPKLVGVFEILKIFLLGCLGLFGSWQIIKIYQFVLFSNKFQDIDFIIADGIFHLIALLFLIVHFSSINRTMINRRLFIHIIEGFLNVNFIFTALVLAALAMKGNNSLLLYFVFSPLTLIFACYCVISFMDLRINYPRDSVKDYVRDFFVHIVFTVLFAFGVYHAHLFNSPPIGYAVAAAILLVTAREKVLLCLGGIVISLLLSVLGGGCVGIIGLALLFFFIKMQFIIKHWRPLLVGGVIYSLLLPMHVLADWLFGNGHLYRAFDNIAQTYGAIVDITYKHMVGVVPSIGKMGVFQQVCYIDALFAFVFINFLLLWLYSKNYNTHSALTIAGAFPLVLIGLIFSLKALSTLDTHSHGDHYYSHEGIDNHYGDDYQYVKSYIRTNPDGIIENNLSYHGPNAAPVNSEVHIVKGHVR